MEAPLRPPNALGRHVALTGFMGSGKTTVGRVLAERLGRPFVDLDQELESRAGATIPDLFRTRGEASFRALEEEVACELLSRSESVVIALGGGTVVSEQVRSELRAHAFTVLLEVEPEVAWGRVRGAGRPLAQDAEAFEALYRSREPLYVEAADGTRPTMSTVRFWPRPRFTWSPVGSSALPS